MAQAALAYVGPAVERAVEAQLQNPAPFVSIEGASRTRISGIDVLTDDPIANRRTRLKQYQDDANTLRNRLENAGVSHLAVLPTTAWNRIADNAELFRFQPKEDGSVIASMAPLEEATKRATLSVAWPPLSFIGLGVLVGYALMFAGISYLADFSLMLTAALSLMGIPVGGFIGGTIAQHFFYDDRNRLNPALIARAERRFLKSALSVSKKDLLRLLFPKGEVNTTGVPIRIGLPPAPSEVQENLRAAKAAGFKLTLDTVADAIQLEQSPLSAYVEHRSVHWEREQVAFRESQQERADRKKYERAIMWDKLLDPIVTTSHGSATAIIVQYGEFPIEQAIIDRVLNSSDLV